MTVRRFTDCLSMLLVCVLVACGSKGEPGPAVLDISIFTQPFVEVGDTLTIKPTYLRNLALVPTSPSGPLAVTRALAAPRERFKSLNPEIATIDEVSGLAVGRSSGLATISATDDEGQAATLDLRVTAVVARFGISANKPMPLAIGDSAVLTFGVYDAAGTSVDSVLLWVTITNTNGGRWIYTNGHSSGFEYTPVGLKVVATGVLDTYVRIVRQYPHADRTYVDSVRVTSRAP